MFYSDPLYFLVAASLVAAAVCAYTFYVTLVENLNRWSKNRSSRLLATLQGTQLQLPLAGMALAATGFLSASLMFFSLPPRFSVGFAAVVSVMSAVLVWLQLTKLLRRLETGGVKALNLEEELSLGEIRMPGSMSEGDE